MKILPTQIASQQNYINRVSTDKIDINKRNTGSISFRSNQLNLCQIKLALMSRGIHSELNGKEYGANCIYKMVQIVERLFGHWALPSTISFSNLQDYYYGMYHNKGRVIQFNTNKKCFDTFSKLALNGMSGWRPVVPNKYSSLHPAHIFAHEFGHSAHFNYLSARHGKREATHYWNTLEGSMVPNAVGRLITRYKLGNYSVDSKDMAEFAAERVAKDVCDSLTFKKWDLKSTPDVRYENIFERKWDYQYTSPQSYLDYFMQQVWNGDRDGAMSVADDIETFLTNAEKKHIFSKETLVELKNALIDREDELPELISMYNTSLRELKPIQVQKDVHPAVETVSQTFEQAARTTNPTYNVIKTINDSVKTEQVPENTIPVPTDPFALTGFVLKKAGDYIKKSNKQITENLNKKNKLKLNF